MALINLKHLVEITVYDKKYKERYVIENDIAYEQCEVKLQFANWCKSFYFPTIEEAFKFREDIKSKELSASDYWFDTETFSISTNK